MRLIGLKTVGLSLLLMGGLVQGRMLPEEAVDPVKSIVLEDFSATPAGSFPRGWKTRKPEHYREAALGKYQVVDLPEGKAVRARGGETKIAIYRDLKGFEWNLDTHPYLEWRWKVTRLPEGANEKEHSRNDAAATVFLVWKAPWPHQADTVRYSWSSTLPVGTEFTRRFKRDDIIIVESGADHLNAWRTVRIHIPRLYREKIGKRKPVPPVAIALRTDSNSTHSPAEAYYGTIRICQE